MSQTRRCEVCGGDVEVVFLEGGQKMYVNHGVVPIFLGRDVGGSVSVGRILHWQTCSPGLGIDPEGLRRVVSNGPWKPTPSSGPDRKEIRR